MTRIMSIHQLTVMHLIIILVKIINMGKPTFFNERLDTRLGENRIKVRGTRLNITRDSYVPNAMRYLTRCLNRKRLA